MAFCFRAPFSQGYLAATSIQSSKKSALDELEESVMALWALRLPETLAAQAEFFQAHRELMDETIQGLAKVWKEYADEVASLRNIARVPWDHARHSNDPILAYKTDSFTPRFSDYRYGDGPPSGEARFSDYRYSPEHA